MDITLRKSDPFIFSDQGIFFPEDSNNQPIMMVSQHQALFANGTQFKLDKPAQHPIVRLGPAVGMQPKSPHLLRS